MKKIFSAIAIIASLIFSMSAMAMQSINDNELSKVTGQSGVSMGLNATVDVSFDIVAWGDSDGINTLGSTYTSAGWVGLKDGDVVALKITPRQDAAFALEYTPTAAQAAVITAAYNAAIAAGATTAQAQAAAGVARVILANQFLTIDVGSNSSNKTMVRIGLPTAWVTMTSFDATAGLWTDAKTAANFQELGTLYVGGMDLKVARDGYVDIYAAGDSGITMDLNAKIKTININSLSWGDKDGVAVYSGTATPRPDAGFVGLTDLAITDLSLTNMKATVNVATAFASIAWTGTLNAADRNTIFYYKSAAGECGSTWVDLGIEGTVGIATLSANAALGTTKALDGPSATAPQVLGQLYVSNLSATIANGSWVTILAH